jgi:hypothetical protein
MRPDFFEDFSKLHPDEQRELLAVDQTDQEAQMALKNMDVRLCIACSKHKPDEARGIAVCDHCFPQDPVRPAGIIMMPQGYVLCRVCFEHYMRKKLRLGSLLKMKCVACLMEEVQRVRLYNPNLVSDLRVKKKDDRLLS